MIKYRKWLSSGKIVGKSLAFNEQEAKVMGLDSTENYVYKAEVNWSGRMTDKPAFVNN